MRIIKLNAIGSTNTFLRQISSADSLEDYTVVVADHQNKGRGQMGTQWSAQKGKNLMCSVLKDVSFLTVEAQFAISIVASLSVFTAINEFKIPKLSIKWPNDIMAGKKKIGGILIENVIKNNRLTNSIIGIGLNVNQTNFDELPNASSLLNITGKPHHINEITLAIVEALQHSFKRLEKGEINQLHQEYERYLFRKNKPSTFIDKEEALFSGYIKGVSKEGNLIVLLEDAIVKEFDLKQIKLMF